MFRKISSEPQSSLRTPPLGSAFCAASVRGCSALMAAGLQAGWVGDGLGLLLLSQDSSHLYQDPTPSTSASQAH